MEHSDRDLVCASCGQGFLFSAGEQAYYAQNGLQEPRRCKPCRAQRKAGNGAGAGGGGGGGGGDRRRGGGNGGPRGPRGAQSPRLASPEDPNGYRAPAFHTPRQDRALGAADLPFDDEADGQVAMLKLGPTSSQEVDRFGLRTNLPAPAVTRPHRPARGPAGPRGLGARPIDRSGTDPNAYRSPGFTGNEVRAGAPRAVAAPVASSSRERRSQRMRHEAVCGDCGVQAMVPFQPGPDRPAYCKPCYQIRKANGTAPMPRPSAQSAVEAAPPAAGVPAIAPVADNAGE